MSISSSLERLEEVKKIIKSLLISEPNREITLPFLSRLYYQLTDENLPFNDFNYTNLKDFLMSMPDVVHLYSNNDKIYVEPIESEKSQHIRDLVIKAKKQNPIGKIRLINLIDPSLLYKVLQESMDLCSKDDLKSISKYAVLSNINNQTEKHTYYTIQELSCQLHQFTHILTHDDDYIYFKEQVIMEDHNYSCDMDQSFSGESVGDLIRNKTKTRLKDLIEKYPQGIWCSELPAKYQEMYKIELEYTDVGFNSILEFVAALPDIFHLVTPPNVKRQMVLDARKPLSSYEVLHHSMGPQYKRERIQIIDCDLTENNAIPTSVSYKVAESLMPDGFMAFYDTVDVILVDSLNKNVDVEVSEVLHPSFFWVTLRENKNILSKLMGDLYEFYAEQDFDQLRVPQILLQPGFNVACRSGDIWHRGILKRVKPNDIEVLFYDSGATEKIKNDEIYYLNKKFMNVPAQAIPCGIHNVKPKNKNKWLTPVCKKFLNRVLDKTFTASIVEANSIGNSMMVNLIDGSKQNIKIDQWLIDLNLADPGELYCKKLNPTFEHYQLCLFKKDPSSCPVNMYSENSSQSSSNSEKSSKNSSKSRKTLSSSSDNETMPLRYLTTREKLEALKKYKARYPESSKASNY